MLKNTVKPLTIHPIHLSGIVWLLKAADG